MLREALTLDRLRSMPPEEASAYFVSRGVDGLIPSEEELLATWLAVDPANATALDRARRAWDYFDSAEGDEILGAMRVHARASRPARWRVLPVAAAVAAMLCAVVTASLLLIPSLGPALMRPGRTTGPQVAWTHYVSAHGEVRQFSLADGSSMTLDTDSAAEAHFSGRERAVRLVRGRGLFEVKKDPARPFAVASASRRVVALGTRFEVDMQDRELRVTLFRGAVAVRPIADDGQDVILHAGQRFIERDGRITVGIVGDSSPGWLRRLIDLDDTPLVDAARQVNRYSRTQIAIADPAVARIRVSGQFRTGDAERFARTVADVYPVRVVRQGNVIGLLPKN
jgi:transmembrane sensor